MFPGTSECLITADDVEVSSEEFRVLVATLGTSESGSATDNQQTRSRTRREADTCSRDSYKCGDECVYKHQPCNGTCYEDRYKCGSLCVWGFCKCGAVTLTRDSLQYCCLSPEDSCSYSGISSSGNAWRPVCSTGQAVGTAELCHGACPHNDDPAPTTSDDGVLNCCPSNYKIQTEAAGHKT